MPAAADFGAFKDTWLEEVTTDGLSTVELEARFANEIVAQWLEVDYVSYRRRQQTHSRPGKSVEFQ